MGVNVSETTSETSTASDSVMANSKNMRPMNPPMKSSGTKTATSDTLIEVTVKPTSRAPCSAARKGGMSRSMWRAMFSTTTMASSTRKPIDTIKAINDSVSSEKPMTCIIAKVPISETGIARLGIKVARALRRNRNTTSTTSAMASISVSWVSCSEARMPGARSSCTLSEALCGNWLSSVAMRSRMPAMVSMTLAPLLALITRSTAGWSFWKPTL